MKTKHIILIAFLFAGTVALAQPLPPTTPSGNPVPVESLVMLLFAAIAGLGITKLRKKK